MRWARTLMLAEMLTKAIRDNVSHEAAPSAAPSKWPIIDSDTEKDMGDDITATTTPAPATPDTAAVPDPTSAPVAPTLQDVPAEAPPAPAPAPTVSQPAASPVAAAVDDIEKRIQLFQHLATLVQVLSDKPDVMTLLHKLLGDPAPKDPAA